MNFEFHPSIHDLLSECFDAVLYCPRHDDTRENHINFLKKFISNTEIDDGVRALFEKILDNFAIRRGFMFSEDERKENDILAKQIYEKMKELNLERHVYHGTIFGRLKDIQKKGLLPGAAAVWKEHLVPRQHCDGAVFFSLTWRGALGWAEAAHYSSRGPREGTFRRPVVLRLPMTGLSLEYDPLSTRSDSYMARSSVSLKDPQVIIGRQGGFPIWRPLAEVLSE